MEELNPCSWISDSFQAPALDRNNAWWCYNGRLLRRRAPAECTHSDHLLQKIRRLEGKIRFCVSGGGSGSLTFEARHFRKQGTDNYVNMYTYMFKMPLKYSLNSNDD
jgi:hypothetical protein